MRGIKHYIVTYNNSKKLNECLDSVFAVDLSYVDYKVYIINNHSNFELNPRYQSKVTVLHNVLRPDFSTGHLSRNWNQCLINGFKNLNNPDCDILITCHDDTVFKPTYLTQILDYSLSYDIMQFGHGDNCMVYTPKGVKEVGLWDERFCNIGYQEADYLLRMLKYLPRCTINDPIHGRIFNVVDTILTDADTGYLRREQYHTDSMKYHLHSYNVFIKKWNILPSLWKDGASSAIQLCDSYIMYPYFEYDVSTLKAQRYNLPHVHRQIPDVY